jgi:hypothetical protein
LELVQFDGQSATLLLGGIVIALASRNQNAVRRYLLGTIAIVSNLAHL